MQSDSTKTIAEQALQQLIDALDQGNSAALNRYLATMAKFHDYSYGNVFMIQAQRPDATQVAGYQTWRKLGRQVRKGEKGIVIFAPMRFRPQADEDEPDADPILRFRQVHVFDISQTEGDPLPEPSRVQGEPQAYLPYLRMAVRGFDIALAYEVLPHGTHGLSMGGRIVIGSHLSPAEEFATLVHELAHERLHRKPDRPECQTVRETEAEAVAFVVSTAIGLDAINASTDYIRLYRGDAKTLCVSLARVQSTASDILAAMEATVSATDRRALSEPAASTRSL